jgi:hypothetical protein
MAWSCWGVAALLYAGVAPAGRGPELSLAPGVLPSHAAPSLGRMSAASALSLGVALLYERAAARHRQAEQLLLPLEDLMRYESIQPWLLLLDQREKSLPVPGSGPFEDHSGGRHRRRLRRRGFEMLILPSLTTISSAPTAHPPL